MRVIAGTYRGIRLSAPPGLSARPTLDRVKESLFGILSSRMSFSAVQILDICAGTGSLGIEALSRGAAVATFIERDRTMRAFLQKNLAATRSLDRSEVLGTDALSAVSSLGIRGNRYDLILFDPPYDSELYLTVTELLSALNLLKPGGILVMECSSRKQLPRFIGSFVQSERRVYGDTALELYSWEEE
jgi:16S rRNA (guanine(966)-N(2))-methyltransferase RsmD